MFKKAANNNISTLIKLSLLFDLPISTAYITPFYLAHGVSASGIFLLQSVFSIVFLLWNIPSGYLADKYGKANAIKVGGPIAGLSMILYGFGGHFWQYALCEVGLALGEGLINGTNQALLIDSLHTINKADTFVRVTQKMQTITFAGTAIAVPLSILLVSKIGLGSTLVADGILYVVGAMLAVRLKEIKNPDEHFVRSKLETWHNLIGFIKKSNVRFLLLLTISLSGATYLAFWLIGPYYISLGIPLYAFSLILAGRSLWKSWLSHKFNKNKNMTKNMLFYSAGI